MKNQYMIRSIYFSLFVVFPFLLSAQTTVFINELHYDNASTDVNEGVEIAGPSGTDLSGWSIVFYNGGDGSVDKTLGLTGTIPDQQNGFGTLWFPQSAIQNGSPDALALVDGSSTVIQFLSYEGFFTAIDGVAVGMESVNIEVEETSSTTSSESLQLIGQGTTYEDFTWAEQPFTATNGLVNTNQYLGMMPAVDNHVTDFAVADSNFSQVWLSWTNSTGTNLPLGYLIKGSITSFVDIVDPVDGNVEQENSLVSDLLYGEDNAFFAGLQASTTYYFKIFPYSNTGADIDYKTEGTVPALTVTTASSDTILLFYDFEYGLNTLVISDSGSQEWEWSSVGANNTGHSAYINGYNGPDAINIDWIFTQPVNLDAWINEAITFYNQWNYGTYDDREYLKLVYSTDFDGQPDSYNQATWTELPFDLAPGSLTWHMTGEIDVSGIDAPTVYFALKYRSDDNQRAWWIDEFTLKGDYTGDATAPVFNPGFPKTDDVRETRLDVAFNMNEVGTVYFLLLNHGDPAPSVNDIKSGGIMNYTNANSVFSTTIDTLTEGTPYDIYFIATDTAGNDQAAYTLVEVTTQKRELELTFPVGGENFFVNDTIVIRWTSANIDSIQIWARGFEEDTWYPVLGEEDTKVDAGQDSIVLHIPLSAGLDSTYFRITDALDFTFFDSCGIFYLTDTIKPMIHSLEPANKDSNVVTNPVLILSLDERAFLGTGNIMIKRKTDDAVHETIPVSSDQVVIGYNEIHIELGMPLERSTTYYVIVEAGAFMDFQDNVFDGILDDTTWFFTTTGPDLFITEYAEGGNNRKAFEIYNPTDAVVSLDNYRIAQSSNGGGWQFYHYFPGGSILAPEDFWIIISDDTNFTDTTYFDPTDADEQLSYPSVINFNGNDARALEKNIDGEWVIIDIFGDPIKIDTFDVAGIDKAGMNHTILRKDFVMFGNSDWYASAGTNAFDSEWKVMDIDYFDNLGKLTMPSDTLAEIDSFSLAEQTMPAVIDSAAATIAIEVALGTKLDSLFPYIEVSPNAGIEPASGDSVDFSGGPVDFTVTAEDRQHVKVWTVTVTEKTTASSDNDIVTFVLANQTKAATINKVTHLVTAEVEYGTSLTALTPTITVSAGATIDPASGVARDFSDTVNYIVTAQDATAQVWKVVVTVEEPIAVATMAELRAGTTDNATLYKLTGEVVLTHAIAYRNKKYVQDATGGIEVDDSPGKITTTYAVGDGITGLVGTLENYSGLIQLHPVEDPGAATSTGNTVTPVVVTAAGLNANYNDYESELVTLRGVTFADAGSNFTGGTNYDLQQGTDVTVFRAHFYDADYIGTAIPAGLQSVTGIVLEYNTEAEVASRNAADIVPFVVSSEKDIVTFVLAEQTGNAVINSTNKTVDIEVAEGTVLTALTPTITVSDFATIDPASGVAQDFTSPVTYTVTAEDATTEDWTVTVSLETGIDQLFDNNLFEVYPNPSQGRFTLKLVAETNTDFEISITNLNGQVMMIRTIEVYNELSETLDLTHFDSGIYLMKVRTSEHIQIEKLIIE